MNSGAMASATDPAELLRRVLAPTASEGVAGRNVTSPIRAPMTEKPWPFMDPAAYHGLAGDVVSALDPTTESDPVAVLVMFLLSFGNAVGRGAWYHVGEDRHGTNLNAVLVGETSKARKGSSRGGVLRVMGHADEGWARDRVQGGLSSGEGLIWAVRDQIERVEAVKEKGRVVGHQTVVVDPGVADKRLLCIEEEFSSVLKQTQRTGNTVSETMRRAWDGRPVLASMTKNSPARATGAHISILGHVTRDELARTLTDTETANGLGNRFLWFAVRRSKARAFLPRLSDQDAAGFGERVASALVLAQSAGEIAIDSATRDAWEVVYPEVSAGAPGIAGSLTARAEAQVLRLALVYALLDRTRVVGLSHLRAALAVVDYACESVNLVFGDATGDPIADRILAALRQNGPMAQGQVMDLFGRNVPAATLNKSLETLLIAGKVVSQQEETGGRPRTVWAAVAV